jgi:cellulose synthase/poly-beta-1,6-N-acetylglucosamine synthase-like glycosyltransferase
VSFVISAYNEADVIRDKIANALALDYPASAREIVVISDCSNDGTDEIVREFAWRGVKLARMTERRGKTAGLNAVVPTLTGDIVVFSDANAMYERDALRKLVATSATRRSAMSPARPAISRTATRPPTSASVRTGTTRSR